MICKNCGYDDNGTGDFSHACKPQQAPDGFARNDEEPAFPVSTSNPYSGHQDGPNTWQFPGMTLRDYFAAKAMQGLLAQSCGTAFGSDPTHGAQYAYKMADAMLATRSAWPGEWK